MKWLKSFLGVKDKAQAKRTQEVTAIVREKRIKFTSDIRKLRHQAKKVHDQASKTTLESARLVTMVVDVTTKIAIATGSLKKDE